ncbi:hypothetical protein SKAU_G00308430 [Synaphobranchus kaupii]|uniref:Uncharacterized protein n=1 Tax=Synaphobranchus kaupii TaxID=118154 RepID=A0A9Q1ERE2_SYNKA|nr:hypothetical protein SKAU_G00308430 [Synaphobranchus kaupii]
MSPKQFCSALLQIPGFISNLDVIAGTKASVQRSLSLFKRRSFVSSKRIPRSLLQGCRSRDVRCETISKELQPTTPTTPDCAHAVCRTHPDSMDGDSSSDYVNNTSDEEEDFDEGLPEEDEGVTYYIRYCPEDDSYLEGVECGEPAPDADQSQEAVEEWAEPEGQSEVPEEPADEQRFDGSPEPLPEQRPASLRVPKLENEEAEGEECEGYCPNEAEEGEEPDGGDYTGDYYAPEHNGTSVPASPCREGG